MIDTSQNRTSTDIAKIAWLHFPFVAAYSTIVIIYDAWQLLPSTAILQRWTMGMLLLAISAVVWFLSKYRNGGSIYYQLIAFVLIISDILFAGFNVYHQRGMASRTVFFFILPLIVAAALRSKMALLSTAVLCIAAYIFAAVRYFATYPGEGYKIELYGELGFYSALFVLLAYFLWALVRKN